jgi:hypothetical protein
LGLGLACFHNWFLKRMVYFWPNFIYLFILIFAYYTIRSSTFYIVYFVLFRFVPVYILVMFINEIIKKSVLNPIKRRFTYEVQGNKNNA